MSYARVIGTGGYLPEKVLTNADLEAMVETTAQWIYERTGVEERHIAAEGETTADLAEHAARQALAAADLDPRSLDLIIVATTTADHVFPSVATQLQERLGNVGAAAFDVQAVCTGFVYALGICDQFFRAGSSQRALVVGAETFSRIIDWHDRNTCILFGDGAGAVVLEASDTPGIHSSHLHADGRYRELLWVPGGVSRGMTLPENSPYVAMKGSEVFKVAVTTLTRVVEETLATNGLEVSDLDWLIPHQANTRILAATAKRLQFPVDRVVNTVSHHANTSAASVPLALDDAVRSGKIQRGETLLMEAFGGGFTWGSALVKY